MKQQNRPCSAGP